jgi:hypothetical protein
MALPACWSIKQSENGPDHRQLSAQEMCPTNSSLHTRARGYAKKQVCMRRSPSSAVASAAREAGEKLILSRLEHSDLTLYITIGGVQWLQLSDLRQLLHFLYTAMKWENDKNSKPSCKLCPRLNTSQRGTWCKKILNFTYRLNLTLHIK